MPGAAASSRQQPRIPKRANPSPIQHFRSTLASPISIFAESLAMALHGIFVWLVIGAVAGWLAGLLVKGGGFGLIVDIIVGIVGAFIGGWLAGVLGISLGGGLLGSIITATIGAVLLLFLIRLFKRA
jgi:uncharacterized membrane protein YeaQ/YmgE (transglycosylase-associated protein family)